MSSIRNGMQSVLARAVIVPAVAMIFLVAVVSSHAQTSTQSVGNKLPPCGAYDAAVLQPRPIPPGLGIDAQFKLIAETGFRTPATMMAAPGPLPTVWYNSVKVTPEEAKKICEKHLTAVYLDWSGVPYNLAMRSGAKTVLNALGIKLLRVANYNLNPNGLTGLVAAMLPLHPDILLTGGTVNPAQFAAILKPALDKGIIVVSWNVGSPTLKVGQNEPIKSIVNYDEYNMGLQMAAAVHRIYPNGTNLGYIHWVNSSPIVHTREGGFLDGLKDYPNIHVITNGKPSPVNPASGFTNPSAAAPFTEAFLTAHPNVNVLFAPWEDPPAIGEGAAVKSLQLQGKVHIVTMDFGEAGAYQLNHKGTIVLDMAEGVYDGGRTMALLAGLAAIGEDTYPYVMVPTYPVTGATNIRAAWDFMHGPQVACPPTDCR